jgi:hypothetical protein
MKFTIHAVLAAALIAMPSLSQAQVAKANAVTAVATIQAIDSTTRSVTLKNEKGEEDTFQIGPEVKRFDEFKVGDKVRLTYYESVVFQLRKPGETSNPAGTAGAAGRSSTPVDNGYDPGRPYRDSQDRGQEEPRGRQSWRPHRHYVHAGTDREPRASELTYDVQRRERRVRRVFTSPKRPRRSPRARRCTLFVV